MSESAVGRSTVQHAAGLQTTDRYQLQCPLLNCRQPRVARAQRASRDGWCKPINELTLGNVLLHLIGLRPVRNSCGLDKSLAWRRWNAKTRGMEPSLITASTTRHENDQKGRGRRGNRGRDPLTKLGRMWLEPSQPSRMKYATIGHAQSTSFKSHPQRAMYPESLIRRMHDKDRMMDKPCNIGCQGHNKSALHPLTPTSSKVTLVSMSVMSSVESTATFSWLGLT
jgi:hypothetical protein